MQDREPLPLDELLAPIPDGAPCGRNLRGPDGMDPALRELREQVQGALREEAAVESGTADQPGRDPTFAATTQWLGVQRRALEIIREDSKDLTVASMYLQGAVRTDGFRGLADGCMLVKGLVETYWTQMLERAGLDPAQIEQHNSAPDDHPVGNEEISTIDSLVRPLAMLNDQLEIWITRIPLTKGGDSGDFALWQYARGHALDPKMTESEREERKTLLDNVLKSVPLTAKFHPNHFTELLADVTAAKAQTQVYEEAFDSRLMGELGQLRPTLTKIRTKLDDVERCLGDIAKDYIRTAPAATSAVAGEPGANGQPDRGSANGFGGGSLRDREDAFRELERIAAFFALTEPLSLLAEQIRQVVHRGRLPPKDYYRELIDNPDTLKQFFRLVGIQSAGEGSDEEQ